MTHFSVKGSAKKHSLRWQQSNVFSACKKTPNSYFLLIKVKASSFHGIFGSLVAIHLNIIHKSIRL